MSTKRLWKHKTNRLNSDGKLFICNPKEYPDEDTYMQDVMTTKPHVTDIQPAADDLGNWTMVVVPDKEKK